MRSPLTHGVARRLPLVAALTLASCTPAPRPDDGEGGQPVREDVGAELLAVADALEAGKNAYVGRAQVDELREELEGALDPVRRAYLHGELARHLLRVGDVDGAVEAIERAHQLTTTHFDPETVDPSLLEGRSRIRHVRAQVYLRQAEVENCIARNNRDCCIFPLADGGVHVDREPARKALALYLELADEEPEGLTWRWIANLLAMALGEHPGALPDEVVIPDAAFDSEAPFRRFRDVAPALGVDVFSLCGGSAIEDLDGDGFLDLVVSDFDPRGSLRVLMRDPEGGFVDATERAGVADQLGGLNLVAADHDSDGDVDLFVLRGAWLLEEGHIRNSLLENDGTGRFTDVTERVGLLEPRSPTQSAAFLDIEGDGDLDLYVANEGVRREDGAHEGLPSQLFRQEEDGTYTETGEAANERYAKGVAAGDADGDGDVDLYVSNIGDGELGVNRLYLNDGAGGFEDEARRRRVEGPSWSFATWFFDYDNDGRLDLFVGGYDADVPDVAADYLGREDDATRPRLYRNEGARFRDVAAEVGLDRPFLPMGANFGDLDGDGWLDLYLATGNPPFETLMPNVALRNDRGERFVDVTRAAGLGHLQKGHGVSFADLDHDGDLDLFHELGGFYPGDGFRNALFENPGPAEGPAARFLELELVGTTSNRSAYGARVTALLPDGREVHRAVGSVSSFGGAPRRLHLGLGDAERIERLTVRWPGGDSTTTLLGVEPGVLLRLVEGESEHEAVELEPAPFPD